MVYCLIISHKPKSFNDPAKYNQELFTMPKITMYIVWNKSWSRQLFKNLLTSANEVRAKLMSCSNKCLKTEHNAGWTLHYVDFQTIFGLKLFLLWNSRYFFLIPAKVIY